LNIDQLLADLAQNQIQVYLDGDRLRYRAPEGAITDDVRVVIGANRAAIIDWLQGSNPPQPPCQGKCAGCDRRNWKDHPPKDGRILTTCGRCDHFIGYRPTNP
jgi:hypothetical protein